MDNMIYKKRFGTSGISGMFYETKLISLIYFRAIHDENIEDFWIASNMDGLGLFDDICFKVKMKGIERPVAVFIQTKHRESDNVLTLTNTNELADYFETYLKFRRSFSPSDLLFNEKFSDLDFLFVHYTNAKDDFDKKIYCGNWADILMNLIGTGEEGTQLCYRNEDVRALCKIALKDELIVLAEQMAKYLGDRLNFELLMNDKLMLRYHTILAQKVMNVSDVHPEGHRIAHFRQEFLDTNDEFLKLFRDTLFTELLRKKTDNEEMSLLNTFKVPAFFGTMDLIISGTHERIEKRLNYLTSKLLILFHDSTPDKIVTINESTEPGILRLNGGIAGAFGTLFVPDENPKLIKFTDDYESLGELAQRLYHKLIAREQNISQYKFDIQVRTMPKLSFTYNEYEENLARDFLNKLLFYSNQAHEQEVEDILEHEINEITHAGRHTPDAFSNHAMFLVYHDEIQKWWMRSKDSPYLTKQSNFYEKSIKYHFKRRET